MRHNRKMEDHQRPKGKGLQCTFVLARGEPDKWQNDYHMLSHGIRTDTRDQGGILHKIGGWC